MDRHLRPAVLTADPGSPDAIKTWRHWKRTFDFFLESLPQPQAEGAAAPNKLATLVNYVGPSVYELIADADTYDSAIQTLETAFDKPKNEVFARHLLATCKQEPGQSLDQYLQKLKTLAKDCNFKAVSAEVHKNEAIRDAFISGLTSPNIRQRLLEQKELKLETAFDSARSLELAEKQSLSYRTDSVTAATSATPTTCENQDVQIAAATKSNEEKCYFCGNKRHPRSKCPARDETCNTCGIQGHFYKVCRKNSSQKNRKTVSAMKNKEATLGASISAGMDHMKNAQITLTVNGLQLTALVDTGSTDSYINSRIAKERNWKVTPSASCINMASTSLTKKTQGHCIASLTYKDRQYTQKLSLLPDLCADVILGHDFMSQHSEICFPFNGSQEPLSICGVAAAKVDAPSLFENLTKDCKPVATKSRRHSVANERFIQTEVQKLLKDGIIEPSTSPWRAQVLVTTNDRHKKRLVIDYSQTINKFTLLDAYPLPRLDTMAEAISKYKYYSTLDLKSAYHQVAIKDTDKPYTAFEACGNLYHFKRIPFGVTNGVASFQRTIDGIIHKENLHSVFAYIDNVTVCGNSKEEHAENLRLFLEAASEYGLTFNDSKSILEVEEIDLLGYRISQGEIRPDPERLRPLREMDPPASLRAQKRACGMFAYYSPWLSHFSDKIRVLNENTTFPLPSEVLSAFHKLKQELENAVLVTIDSRLPLTVETDASDVAISATLNQEGRPVAFFSRTLSSSERHHSAVEKEAYAIVEAIRKWRHYLLGTTFKLITDQKSVAFIYDKHQRGKVKNDKIQRWKIELSCYNYDVVYRPGPENLVADALSRATCGATSSSNLKALHDVMCHPGVTRMVHFVRARNLPYSVEEIKAMTSSCAVCAEIKPRFYKPEQEPVIKATQPFERLSIDFKGPLKTCSRNRYLLTIIDEYSRFPFAFPCQDLSTATVIHCLIQVFAVFGMPQYIHSDRGSAFMSVELKTYLHGKGIATSRTTPYNPKGNGQVERLNGTLWKTVTLALKSCKYEITQWELVLQDSLHAVRSLLCTETNATPHERMFSHRRRSTSGNSLPTWLLTPGPVYLKRHVRASKYDPLVDEVELLEANPHYAHVRLPDGRESTVSLRHLAPVGEEREEERQNENSSLLPSQPLSKSGDINSQPAPESGSEGLDTEELHTEELPNSVTPLESDTPSTPITKAPSVKPTPFIRTSHYNLRSGLK